MIPIYIYYIEFYYIIKHIIGVIYHRCSRDYCISQVGCISISRCNKICQSKWFNTQLKNNHHQLSPVSLSQIIPSFAILRQERRNCVSKSVFVYNFLFWKWKESAEKAVSKRSCTMGITMCKRTLLNLFVSNEKQAWDTCSAVFTPVFFLQTFVIGLHRSCGTDYAPIVVLR